MTTHLRQSSHPRLPAPSAYTHYLNRLERERRNAILRRRIRYLRIAIVALAALGLAAIAYILTQ